MKKYENMKWEDIRSLPHEEYKKIPDEYKKKQWMNLKRNGIGKILM